MSDITFQIEHSPKHQTLIKEKLEDPLFTHKNWLDPDLASLRSSIRNHYRKQQVGLCAYCKNELSLKAVGNARIEHIVPKSKRRDFIFESKNLCVICDDCNTIKSNQDVSNSAPNPLKKNITKQYPRSSGAFLIVHPHFDKWEEHIVKFNTVYVDKTDKGSFTIGACVLNRRLREYGWEADFVDEAALSDAMNKYQNEKNPLRKAQLYTAMRKLMFIA
jgi:uncharacterized protein (TIGR02646 family)